METNDRRDGDPGRPRSVPPTRPLFPAGCPHVWMPLWTDPGGPRLTNATELWDTCAQSIREQVSDGVWNSTFKEARPHAVGEHELVLTVPSQWVKERIEARYFQMVLQALDEVADRPVQMIIEVDTDTHLDADLHAHLAVTGTDTVDIDLTRPPSAPDHHDAPATPGDADPWGLDVADAPDRRRLERPPGPLDRWERQRPLHLRQLRHRYLQPLRPRRSAVGRRTPVTLVQPAVHLRRRRARQDPSPTGHRQLRQRQLRGLAHVATSRPRPS